MSTVVHPGVDPRDIRGVIPIIVTAFTESGAIDAQGIASQIRFLVERGIAWVGLGYGSEVPRLTARERGEIVRIIRDAGGRDLGIVSNAEVTGRETGIEALEAAADGADAVMVRPAHVQGVPAEALLETLAGVFAAVEVPIILQDAPQHTGVLLDAATLANVMREVSEVVAVKIEPPAGATAKIGDVRRLLDGAEGRILGGLGGKDYILELRAGSDGTMPGPAYPELYQAIETFVRAGRDEAAWRLIGRLTPLMGVGAVASNMDGFLHTQKYILAKRGVKIGTTLRAPANVIGPDVDALVDEIWSAVDAERVLAEAIEQAAGADA